MDDDRDLRVILARLDQRLLALEDLLRSWIERFDSHLEKEDDQREMNSQIRREVGEVKTQIRLTWTVLLLVVGGIVTVAFSIWQGNVP